jgi:hypothetical protein
MRGIMTDTHVSGWVSDDEWPISQGREARFGRARQLMNPLRRNEEELAFDCCFGLTFAEQAALRPLESLHLEPCPAGTGRAYGSTSLRDGPRGTNACTHRNPSSAFA